MGLTIYDIAKEAGVSASTVSRVINARPGIKKSTRERVEKILEALDDEETYGFVLRAKGMLPEKDGSWIHFDYVPGEGSVREGAPDVTGKFCVIGSGLREDALKELFTA